MRIAFLSNYLNHFQLPFCQEIIKIVGQDNFVFIACSPFDVSRTKCGFDDMNGNYRWVIRAYQNDENVIDILKNFDVVISIPELTYYNSIRLQTGKLTFFTSERLLKRGYFWRWNPLKIWRSYKRINKFKNCNLFILCCGAYVAYDYIYSGFPKNRYYTWAYLPRVTSKYVCKNNNEVNILWVGRMLEIKRPFDLLEACEELFSQGYHFNVTYIGDGPLAEKLRIRIAQSKYASYIKYIGSLKNEEVVRKMEQQSIFVTTSNRFEGWGAVVNEAMSSGCCVIASDAMGSVPILIKNGVNGLIYKCGNIQQLSEKIKFCLDNPAEVEKMQKQAVITMQKDWNAAVGAERFLTLVNDLLNHESPKSFKEGLCSPALISKY